MPYINITWNVVRRYSRSIRTIPCTAQTPRDMPMLKSNNFKTPQEGPRQAGHKLGILYIGFVFDNFPIPFLNIFRGDLSGCFMGFPTPIQHMQGWNIPFRGTPHPNIVISWGIGALPYHLSVYHFIQFPKWSYGRRGSHSYLIWGF